MAGAAVSPAIYLLSPQRASTANRHVCCLLLIADARISVAHFAQYKCFDDDAQALYTFPNRDTLVLLPLRRSGASLAQVAFAFGLFMASRAFLVYVQTRVIGGPFGATGAQRDAVVDQSRRNRSCFSD